MFLALYSWSNNFEYLQTRTFPWLPTWDRRPWTDDNTGREYQSLWLELGQLGSFPYCIISMKISWKHVRNIDKLLITNYWYVKSTQFKKLAANALLFTYKSLKSCKSHEKNETMNIRLSVLSFSSINLALLRFLFCFFM